MLNTTHVTHINMYIYIYSSSVFQGGDSTQEEMCLSFVAYYPSLDLSVCVSRPAIPALQIFTDQYIP